MIWFAMFMLVFLLGCFTVSLLQAIQSWQDNDHGAFIGMISASLVALAGLAANFDWVMRL